MTADHAGASPQGALRWRRSALTIVPAALILINQAVGVTCQFMQSTDPRFPLLYFTVDSAVLAGIAALLTLLTGGRRGGWRLRLAAAVGVCVSALVFATVIVPATPTGTWFQPHDDWAVRTANMLLHGVAPVLVVADYAARAEMPSVRRSLVWSYAWPLGYLAGLMILAALFGGDVIPYPFLQPAVAGWPTVAGAVVALVALVALLGVILAVLCRVAAAHRSSAILGSDRGRSVEMVDGGNRPGEAPDDGGR